VKADHLSWSLISLFSAIHLGAFLYAFGWHSAIYILVLMLLAGGFLLVRLGNRQGASFDWRLEVLFWLVQAMIAAAAVMQESEYIRLLFFLLFLLVEVIRAIQVRKLSKFSKEINRLDEEIFRMNETFRTVRSERHDFLKHIAAIHFMLEKEEFKEAGAYLDVLVDGYNETNLSIKGESGAVAATLHQYYLKAQKEGMEIIYDIEVPISSMPVPDKELVGLVGNLLENCVEACLNWKKVNQQHAIITLQLVKRSGLYILTVKNKSLPIPAKILDRLYHQYGLSTKAGNERGYGTKIIADIVKKHQGVLDFVYKEEEFTVKIKLPSIR